MAFGVEIGGVRLDHLHMGAGLDRDPVHDDGGEVRHVTQQPDGQARDSQAHQRQRGRAQQQAGEEGQTGQLFGDLAQIDDQQHQQRRLRQRQQGAEDAAAHAIQRVDAIGTALHREDRIERRDHREHHQTMGLARFAEEGADDQPVGEEEGYEQPRHVAGQTQRIKAQPHNFLRDSQ